MILEGGETGCPGVGSGPAILVSDDSGIDSFPEGGVLVARRSSPKFIRLMSKTKAIVTDVGSTTGHMASLAREFRVPTLLNTKIATSTLQPGTVVTVDATNGFVYEGELPELLERNDGANASEDGGAWRGNAPAFQLLEKVISLISPLNLTEPSSAAFAPDHCVTLHDLARFVHEKSYREMFMMGDTVGDLRGAAYKLDVFLPIDIYVVDLGGGIDGTPKHREAEAFSNSFRAHVRAFDGNAAREDSPVRPSPHELKWLSFYYAAPWHDEPRDRRHVWQPMLCNYFGQLHELHRKSRLSL